MKHNERLHHRILFQRHRRGNDFSVGEAKIGKKQSRQSNSKYNFMQYVFFSKKVYACDNTTKLVWSYIKFIQILSGAATQWHFAATKVNL